MPQIPNLALKLRASCEKCEFFEASAGDLDGDCRHDRPDGNRPPPDMKPLHPRVSIDHWCGQWRKRTGPE